MTAVQIHFGSGLALLAAVSMIVGLWVHSASKRVEELQSRDEDAPVAIAAPSDESYCSGRLRPILRRVLTSCGLLREGGGRGCQPLEASRVASMSGDDFNALFRPLSDRAAIIEFAKDSDELDAAAAGALERAFADQRGASYFLVVARASPEGSVAHNRELSKRRAEAVLTHLEETFNDPDLEGEVGLLWLGEEFAQLDEAFCSWTRSHPNVPCTPEGLNRSAFVAWIDCQL